jgi:hypothetical protein
MPLSSFWEPSAFAAAEWRPVPLAIWVAFATDLEFLRIDSS